MMRQKVVFSLLHLMLALIVTSGILFLAVNGGSFVPPLGTVLNPGTGVWTAASDARPLQNQTLHFSALQHAVTVIFETNGTPHIQAESDHDLFWTIGYLQARFRLVQMDLMRRQGEGLLAEVFGPQALSSDRFQVMLGLDRVAKTEWDALPENSDTRQILQSFSAGINARITEETRTNSLPPIFKLLNYQPKTWTPVDTLVIQGDVTQDLDFSMTPLNYALLVKALGYQRTMQWFPVIASDLQHPYDTTSYAQTSSTPMPLQTQLIGTTQANISVENTLALLTDLPNMHLGAESSASNAWAVNGPKAADGKALMAGDPHLDLSLPAIWYQLDAASPHYAFSGVTVPGIPLALIGHNQHISWSMTDMQNQSTLFYVEKTNAAHQYYWQGSWHPMQHISYSIPVHGQSAVMQDVYLTVHGPLLAANNSLPGETMSVDWMGAIPANNVAAFLNVVQASNFAQFRSALSTWTAPTLNFVYADDQGNIGMISPGLYPIIKSGAPWLPLPGTGEADIQGTIPYANVPQVYNPPSHIVFSANQRPVSASYPYYIGTTWNDFDNGYRANEIYQDLESVQSLTTQDMQKMQNSTHDYLASLIVPKIVNALGQITLTRDEQQAVRLLQSWNGNMDANSSAAAIWWTFWNRYMVDTFQPWWQAYHVPASFVKQGIGLEINAGQSSLDMDLETWTLHDQNNAVFTPPKSAPRNAAHVMQQALKETVNMLQKTLGSSLQQWSWGRLHTRSIPSLLQAQALGYEDYASGGDSWTINAAPSHPLKAQSPLQNTSIHGPSWRIIVNWGTGQAEGIYPGGQDENPASTWYENQISDWAHGQYTPLIDAAQSAREPNAVIWTLTR